MKFIRSMQENNAARSKVWLVEYKGRHWVHKVQSKYYCDNEQWAYESLDTTGYVPPEWLRLEKEVFMTIYMPPHRITNPELFVDHCEHILGTMTYKLIRHGDLTRYSVIPYDNRPILVDWAECRALCDPRPDKRPEGDRHWLMRTAEELCQSMK